MNRKYNPLLIILLIVIMIFMLFSCSNTSNNQQIEKPIGLRQKSDEEYTNVTEYTYGGCEYIKVGYLQNAWGSHKGNCSNPIHKK